MSNESWDEFRIAFELAKTGTVSGTAERLGVHRSTVIRHVDALEHRLGSKIFHRHQKGYTPTEMGAELIAAGHRADAVISQFVGMSQLRNTEIDGDLIIAAPPPVHPLLVLASQVFQERYPETRIRLISAIEQPKLEYGEVHLYFQVGKKPQSPDYVILPSLNFRNGIYAHRDYIRKHGRPSGLKGLRGHNIVSVHESFPSQSMKWFRDFIRPHDIVFESDSPSTAFRAVIGGIGVGILPTVLAQSESQIELIEGPIPEIEVRCWTVTHVDVHRTPKVQAFTKCLRDLDTRGKYATEIGATSLIAM
ncbi:MAG: LysR family transcriptional regulator [Pseudomonadota bacterium]